MKKNQQQFEVKCGNIALAIWDGNYMEIKVEIKKVLSDILELSLH